jgi:hypothetical protein
MQLQTHMNMRSSQDKLHHLNFILDKWSSRNIK